MASAMRIAALLGLFALAQAQDLEPRYFNTTTFTPSTDPPDCDYSCLHQLPPSDYTAFCSMFTAATQTQIGNSRIVDACGQDCTKVSSACSCVVSSGSPSSSTCQPSTITVTFTPSIPTYTTTHKYVKYHA
jgi:hypothetical protein